MQAKHDLTFEQTSERFGIGIATLFRRQKKLIPCKTRNRSATKINLNSLVGRTPTTHWRHKIQPELTLVLTA